MVYIILIPNVFHVSPLAVFLITFCEHVCCIVLSSRYVHMILLCSATACVP